MIKVPVSVVKIQGASYPEQAPFHPSERYPEYPFGRSITKEKNLVYEGVRQSLYLLDYDREHYNTPEWNPLGHIVKPGMKVVIKPNWVRSRHFGNGDVFSVITHPSVLRAVMDYCWIALKGRGSITLADAPQYDCNFQELMQVCKLRELLAFFSHIQGPEIYIHDLRRYWSPRRHFPSMKRYLSGDPKGVVLVNLGKKSAVYGKKGLEQVYGAVYHRQETRKHHSGETQEYYIGKTILDADVIINVPKLKVHKKVGVTLSMKNFVGASVNTNLNVHYILGSPSEGGDQFPDNLFTPMERNLIRIERWMYDHFLAKQSILLEYVHRSIYWLHGTCMKPFGITVPKSKRVFDAGAWHGNDCAWRFVIDLPRIVTFSDTNGILHNIPQRKIVSLIDGVIAGDNKGPLEPDSKHTGIIITSHNMIAADLVGTRLMGFDYRKLKIFRILQDSYFDFGVHKPEDIAVKSNVKEYEECFNNDTSRYLAFKAHPGWQGAIEIDHTENNKIFASRA